jgi:hypothetical protein
LSGHTRFGDCSQIANNYANNQRCYERGNVAETLVDRETDGGHSQRKKQAWGIPAGDMEHLFIVEFGHVQKRFIENQSVA